MFPIELNQNDTFIANYSILPTAVQGTEEMQVNIKNNNNKRKKEKEKKPVFCRYFYPKVTWTGRDGLIFIPRPKGLPIISKKKNLKRRSSKYIAMKQQQTHRAQLSNSCSLSNIFSPLILSSSQSTSE